MRPLLCWLALAVCGIAGVPEARGGSGTIGVSGPFLGDSIPELRGRVTEVSGTPLAGVTVEGRTEDRTLTATGTDPDGTFRLRLTRAAREALADGRLFLRAERLGYRPEEQRLEPGTEGPIDLALTPAPLPLPGFQVEGGPIRCVESDPEARQLWRRAAARHPGGMDTLGVASYTLVSTDTLAGTEAPKRHPDGLDYEPGQRGSAPILRIGWSRRIEREGYAFPVRRTDRSGSFQSWSYAPLEADLAPHFGTEQFGDRHRFQILERGPDGWRLRFCARDRDDPHLEGRLEISRDTVIRRAEWNILTAEPREDAGGWALFPPPDPEGGVPSLLPLESMTWKTLHGDRTVRRAQWFEGWVLAAGDSVPFLPRRDPEAEGGVRSRRERN